MHQGRAASEGPPQQALSPEVLREVFALDGALVETPAGLTLSAARVARR
jgi:iron complex transport system ATP-binding protein